MNGFDAAQARLDYSAHYGPGDGDGWWKDQACEEFWDDCAAEYAQDRPEYILDREDMGELIQRAARLAWIRATDLSKRALAEELLEIIRAYCVQNESAINAMCIERAEQYRREARDMMRGGE